MVTMATRRLRQRVKIQVSQLWYQQRRCPFHAFSQEDVRFREPEGHGALSVLGWAGTGLPGTDAF